MHILFLTTAHNSLSQRLYIELSALGHHVRVALAASAEAMLHAASAMRPDLILAPMLKKALPDAVWRKWPCIIVHPGIRGDRGPSSLDWAIALGENTWGVTNLQAQAEMDAGPIWAAHEFPMRRRALTKSTLYREDVTEAAVRGTLETVRRFQAGHFKPEALDYGKHDVRGELRPSMKQVERAIDWRGDTTAEIVRKIRAADSSPGVLDTHFGAPMYLFGAHEEDRLKGHAGEVLATRHGAICVGTCDGALWITHLKAAQPSGIKLPAAQVLGSQLNGVPEAPLPIDVPANYRSWREIRYQERDAVGYLYFDCYNGALSTQQCQRLREAYVAARARPTKVIVLMGGRDFFSNGINLNTIEAAADPAEESWRNIIAIDDFVLEMLTTESQITISALRGNAGAGGAMLALAADRVYAREGVVLNPHYKSMGGLYGSEYWTYTLPRRVGPELAARLTEECQPIGTYTARCIGLIDSAFGASVAAFEAQVKDNAQSLAQDQALEALLAKKRSQRLAHEREKPLTAYRHEELARMRTNFFGNDRSYHEARCRFVYKGTPPPTPQERAAQQ